MTLPWRVPSSPEDESVRSVADKLPAGMRTSLRSVESERWTISLTISAAIDPTVIHFLSSERKTREASASSIFTFSLRAFWKRTGSLRGLVASDFASLRMKQASPKCLLITCFPYSSKAPSTSFARSIFKMSGMALAVI